MRLSEYAKKNNITYRTAWNHWKSGKLNGSVLATGTIILEPEKPNNTINQAIIYCRVSSSENKSNLEAQADRVQQYCLAKGYKIYKVVKEVGSGIDDQRPQLIKALQDSNYSTMVVEHKDRLSRFSIVYIELLLNSTGKTLEIINYSEDTRDDLMQDFVSIITSFCARIYGINHSKRNTEKLIKEFENDT